MNPISSVSGTSTSEVTPTERAAASELGGQDTFLRLLVSQIKNQDPLNPMDSMNFVTQLAQFSQLEATLSMRNDLRVLVEQGIEQGIEQQVSGQGNEI